ncbi:MAG: alpha/beta hydrolase [Gammaproteobacteria bacterium]
MSVRATLLLGFIRGVRFVLQPWLRRKMLEDIDPHKFQARIEALARCLPGGPPTTVDYERAAPGGADTIWAIPEGAREGRALLYFPGGGFMIGSPLTTHKDMIWRLAQAANCRVLALDYRLAPRYPFPAALEDAVKAYQWLLGQGYRSENLVIAGDSAGGNLVFGAALKLRAAGLSLPAALVALSPWTDLTVSGESTLYNADKDLILPGRKDLLKGAHVYLNGADGADPLASPLFGKFDGFPPTLIQVGSEEVLLDDSRRLSEKLAAAGVNVQLDVWEKMPHVWHIGARFIPEGKRAIAEIGTFVKAYLADSVA